MEHNLKSISKSLASLNRTTGPKCKLYNSTTICGGSDHPSSDFGRKVLELVYNADPSTLYEFAIKINDGRIVNTGALSVLSGIHTGRSPNDKRLVYYEKDKDYIWWDELSPNIKMQQNTFIINRETTINYLNSMNLLFVFDGYAGWEKENRLKVRVICTRPYHALFMHNMLIRPTQEELLNFGDPDFTIYNAGVFPCNRFLSDMTSSTSIDFDFERKEILILGTQYAGEMKKGIFTVMHYLMPRKNILSLHSSCNVSNDKTNVALFFGLSGTGKTTLSADPERMLVGDDEHCWYDNGVFNIEGGCYAKCIKLSKENEPDIWNAIKYGSIVENTVHNIRTKEINFDDISITENTRASYPINYINNALIPCNTYHPNNIIFLCCDAFGVLPAVSKLTLNQAMYYFISGYTAKIPGTEMGVKEPIPTFSACFGEAFIPCHPKVYAELLKKKIQEHKPNVWLINTGWIKGKYGSQNSQRCPLKYTRNIVKMIHSGELEKLETKKNAIFKLNYFNDIPGIPRDILDPSEAWTNHSDYISTLTLLSDKFKDNFKKFEDGSDLMTELKNEL